VHLSAAARAEKTLLSNSNNNELLVINLATVPGRRNSNFPPAQSRKTLPAISNDHTSIKREYKKLRNKAITLYTIKHFNFNHATLQYGL